MTFLEIIQHELTSLPINSSYKGSFRNLIKNKLETFGNIIETSSDLSGPINGITPNDRIFKRRNRALRKGIIEAIDCYYEGNPSKAYTVLAKAMKDSNATGYLNKEHIISPNTNHFRIRIAGGNFPLEKRELFHIPFESRSKVSTQRYSIPGLPSLYISNCLYVAWEELGRPAFNEIQAVRLANTMELNLLDLTTDIYNHNDHLIDNHSYGWQLLYKVMVWPLVAACSVKVRNSKDPFKPEYIIPQLLMQWINKNNLHGIKYSSSHIEPDMRHKGIFFNIVIPVRTFNLDEGYCPQLVSQFRSTQVLPLQLRQFVTISDRFYNQATITVDVNPYIEEVELIKGHPQPYANTIFGAMEHNLSSLDVEELI